jgi:hypothetical protein
MMSSIWKRNEEKKKKKNQIAKRKDELAQQATHGFVPKNMEWLGMGSMECSVVVHH